jgi:hypothetical protein
MPVAATQHGLMECQSEACKLSLCIVHQYIETSNAYGIWGVVRELHWEVLHDKLGMLMLLYMMYKVMS